MSEELQRAFRAYQELSEEVSAICPDEADFLEMYKILGNREGQDMIRQANPEADHCALLQISPTACSGCPKNPHEGRRLVDRSVISEFGGMVQRSLDLSMYIETASQEMLADLSSTEFMMANLGRQFRRENEQRQMMLALANMMVGAQARRMS